MDLYRLLDLAEATAREVGRMLVDNRPADGPQVVGTKSSATDVVTQMDRAAEKLIRERILAARPDDSFLGEEDGFTAGTSGVRWVVDPIDGTVNYLYGLPDWGVSVAAEMDGEAVAAVICLPVRGEVFTAVKGGGAFLNGEPIRCTTGKMLGSALVGTEFGYAADDRAAQGGVMAAILPRVQGVRVSGATVVDLAWVAAGRLDGWFMLGAQPWDVAAGLLLVSEAGGRIGVRGSLAVAAGSGVFGALDDLLIARSSGSASGPSA